MPSIKERILADASLQDARIARDLDALAAGLNANPEMVAQSRFITARGVMSGCKDGVTILDKLDAIAPNNSAVRRAVGFLNQAAGLDIGDPFTLKMIDQLVANTAATKITVDEGNQLKALCMAPLYVTRDDIANEMFNPDGTEK